MTIEIPDFMQRWIEIDDPWIVGFDWSTHCARTNQPDASTFSTGPGYPISPTRTPWASWWRPKDEFKNDDWLGMPTSHSEGEDAFCLWSQDYELDSTIGIIFAYGDAWSNELPDIQKENPQ